jgi:hypothetical protein
MRARNAGNFLFQLVGSLNTKESNTFAKTLKKGTDAEKLYCLVRQQFEASQGSKNGYNQPSIAKAFGKPQSLPVVKKQLEERIEQWLMQQPLIGSDVGFMNHDMALVEQLVHRHLFAKAHQKIQQLKVAFRGMGRWTRLAALLQYESLFAENFFEEKELMPAVIKLSAETVDSLHKAANLAEYNRLNIQALSMMFNDTAPLEQHRNNALQMLSHPLLQDETQVKSFQAKMVRLGVMQMLYKLCGDENRAIETAYNNAVVCIAEAEGQLPAYVRANGMLNFLHLSEKYPTSPQFAHIISELHKIKLSPEHVVIYELKFFVHSFFHYVAKKQPQKLDALCKQTLQLIHKHEASLEPLTLCIAHYYLGKWYAIEGKYNEAYNLLVHPIIAGLPQNYRSIYLSTLLWKAVVSALSKKPNFALQELNSILYRIKKDFSNAALELKICSLIILHLKKDKLNWKEIYTTLLNEHKTEIMHQQKMEYHSVNIFVFLKAIAQNKTYWQI